MLIKPIKTEITFTDSQEQVQKTIVNNVYINKQIKKYLNKLKDLIMDQYRMIDGSNNITLNFYDDNDTITTCTLLERSSKKDITS
jgi:K+/H+ antiporter YhaU regulatory subunit KhtT